MLWLCFDLWFFLCSAVLCSVTRSCPTLCNSMDCNRPGSSVHSISQARILEWVATSSFRVSSRPRDQTRISCISHIDLGIKPASPPRWILYHRTTWEALILLVPLKTMQNAITFFKTLVISTSYVPNVWFTWNILYKVNLGENKIFKLVSI